MKKLLFIISVIVYFVGLYQLLHSAEATFTWTSANIAYGTKIYIGTESGVYSNSEDAGIGTEVYTVDDLLPATTYYFNATHYDNGIESEMTAEVIYTTPDIDFLPMPPINLPGYVTGLSVQ